MSTKAGEMWDAEMAFKRLESEVEDAIMTACGIDPNDYAKWPHGGITFDDYDASFEFKGVKGDWCPTPEQLAECWALGFSQCWICYDNLDGDGVIERKTYGGNPMEVISTTLIREKHFAAPRLARVFPGEPPTNTAP